MSHLAYTPESHGSTYYIKLVIPDKEALMGLRGCDPLPLAAVDGCRVGLFFDSTVTDCSTDLLIVPIAKVSNVIDVSKYQNLFDASIQGADASKIYIDVSNLLCGRIDVSRL